MVPAIAAAEVSDVIQTPVSPTIDGLFRRVLARQPDALALIDPADKLRVTGQQPRRLTYAQAERAIAALAAHFLDMKLPAKSVVALQLPNTCEFVLTFLALQRAGLIVALLPQLWRQAEMTVALNSIGARAIVTSRSIDGVNHADLVLKAAAEAFLIRSVAGFGDHLPDGMTSLDAVIAEGHRGAALATPESRRTAVISFDVAAQGLCPVPRTHLGLIAGGLAVFLEAGVPQGSHVMSMMAPSSFAAVASVLMTWLLTGGALAFHHPFDTAVLERQLIAEDCAALVGPAILVQRLAAAGSLSRATALRHVVGLWRTPETVAASDAWPCPRTTMTDVYVFGEAGLFSARRGGDGLPARIMAGPHGAPRGDPRSSVAGETFLTPQGTLGLRGPMVAAGPAALTRVPATHDSVDTGYAASVDPSTGALTINAAPPRLVAVGGYRFLSHDLLEWARRLGPGTLLAAQPDEVTGYRLEGHASSNPRARAALSELGLNPLMVEAFRDRRGA